LEAGSTWIAKLLKVARGSADSAPSVAISRELEQLKHVLSGDLHGLGVVWIEIDSWLANLIRCTVHPAASYNVLSDSGVTRDGGRTTVGSRYVGHVLCLHTGETEIPASPKFSAKSGHLFPTYEPAAPRRILPVRQHGLRVPIALRRRNK
jgi:hypothetical protein